MAGYGAMGKGAIGSLPFGRVARPEFVPVTTDWTMVWTVEVVGPCWTAAWSCRGVFSSRPVASAGCVPL